LIDKVLPIEKRLFALGERHLNVTNHDVANLALAFFAHNQHFFTFVHEEGVEPTNNAAERALGTAVRRRSSARATHDGQLHPIHRRSLSTNADGRCRRLG
jgi:hypothetical protein